MYKIYVRQPWDVTWQRWDPKKSYLLKANAQVKVSQLMVSDWATDRTEFLISKETP